MSSPTPTLRGSGFPQLWTAETLSLIGSQVTIFALPLVAVLLLHADAWEMGVLAAASSAATLVLGLSAGVLADRYERITLMRWCNAVRFVLVGSIPLLYRMGVLRLWQLAMVAFAVAAMTLVYDSARAAVVPQFVPQAGLPKANSWMQGSVATADVVGPGLAGLLVQLLGAPIALIADAASYIVGTLVLRGIREVRPAPEPEQDPHLSAIVRGLRYIWRDGVQRPLAIAAGHYNFFHAMFFAGFTLYAVTELHFSVFELGVIGVLTGVAGLIAVTASSTVSRVLGYGRTMFLVYLLPGAAAVLVPLAPWHATALSLVLVCLSQFAWSVIVVTNIVVSETIKQVRTESGMLGRVTSTVRFISSGADPLGALAGGALGSILGLRGTLLLASAGLVTSACWPLARQVRAGRTLADLSRPEVLAEQAPETPREARHAAD